MEAPEAIYTQVKAVFDADTTTLVGLNATADNPNYVRAFSRFGDPRNRATDPSGASIEVDLQSVERSVPTGTTNYEMFDAVFTFIVKVDRDRGLNALDRIENRLRVKYHNASLANLVDTDASGRTWSFAPAARLTPRNLPNDSPRNKWLMRACPYRVIATKGAT